MSVQVNDQNLGHATAYGYALSKGYTGTEDEFAELMASYADVAEQAAESAEQAEASATTATAKASEAAQSATAAASSKTAAETAQGGAETAATTATTQAGNAASSATTASTKASEAAGSASTASTKATEAASSATAAAGSATTASTAATTATTKASEAAASATAAAQSAASLVIDDTLTHAGQAADAKKTGDEITALKEDFIDSLVTDTATGSIASFPDGADGVPAKSLKVNIEPVQSGSGDPSPDNVRPISGHTSAVVTRCGKNLFDFKSDYSDWSDGYLRNDGIPSGTVPAAPAYERTSPYIEIKGGQTYIFSFSNVASATISNNMCFYDKDKNFVGTRITGGAHLYITGTAPENAAYVRVSARTFNSMSNVQLEVGSTATAYEPYQGQTVTIDLDGTRYGGTLDVTTGVLTVDRAIVDMGSLSWVTSSTNLSGIYRMFSTSISDVVKRPESNSVIANTVCSTYKTVAADSTYLNTVGVAITRGGAVSVYDERFNQASDAESFKAAMSGQYMTYELAEPFTVQLTANDITTLLGQNNIWSDAGTVDVEYRADTKLYIEKLTAPTEDDMIADHAISSNSFFMIGNTLYRATTAIASGATITVGTNATRLSLSDALNALS